MIPTMLVLGCGIGLIPRPWYWVGVAAASVGWAALLVHLNIIDASDISNVIGAMVLALLNTLAGALIVKAIGKGFASVWDFVTTADR